MNVKKWIQENSTQSENKYINGINYLFCTMRDGWIAIFKQTPTGWAPMIQAKDEAHAIDYCIKREPAPVAEVLA